ncbi:GspH/FimT family pseudopilin [Haloferula sp. BvORR071]|uniref:prepilin-type N-terminal cleavage/methylation domain-containing protein n=1 Tax=Haloferula sp. BvORR071 TaxID=1396141 RepID=UPI000558ED5B|nr:GspH/FimT family pseudopilin [Haloferula sp. BvORR071]
MKPPFHPSAGPAPGFSLIELLVVIAIIGSLTALGMSVLGTNAAKSQRTATDQFSAAVEQARTAAITRRKPVILAVAEPQPNATDEEARFGLFEVDTLPDAGALIEARQVERWHIVPNGVVFLAGRVQEFENLFDETEVVLSLKGGQEKVSVHALAFDSRGGLAWPKGSDPVAVKLGNGHYASGKPVTVSGGGHNSLRIGRVVARPWRLD